MGSLKMCLVRFWAAFFCVGFFWGRGLFGNLGFQAAFWGWSREWIFANWEGSLKMGYCFVVGFGGSFNHTSRADGALTFLCLAKEK